MIVCHCMSISDKDILAAMAWMRASDRQTIITPGKIYRALGKKPDCGGCLPHFIATMKGSGDLEVPHELRHLRQNNKRHKE
ncbi:BFD-like [2Fe-2S] binding domain-containing protein [Poseidonocella pacifica]|uniref:BFD-like [2Fe-2S] binding domain-containing protein n=1 Tax=Poseidonocella pacifica TaxID=871651 RepID=A0A1I0YGV9_9RHOB|nr:(2Fe-2S)-binding protein [Poseidonocella pacifica]SFB12609.1 BFD-like [2Fe-2S] binding domain-containing protein [Poseidonocella pacifica]